MRHRKKGKKLGRTSGHRKQTLAALSSALIEHKRIQTTLPKAKALRPFVEPLITRAKEDTMHNRKQVFRHLQNKEAIKELFGDVAAQVGDRPGGYTRIIKLGQRAGDGAEMAMIELVDYNDVPPASTGSGGSGGTRRGSGKGRRGQGGSKDAAADTATTEAADATDAEAPEAAAEASDAPAETEAPSESEADEAEAAEAAAAPDAEADVEDAEATAEAEDDEDDDKDDKKS